MTENKQKLTKKVREQTIADYFVKDVLYEEIDKSTLIHNLIQAKARIALLEWELSKKNKVKHGQ